MVLNSCHIEATNLPFYPISLLQSLHRQQQSGQHTDISLSSGDHTVSVHSVLLRNSSPFLNYLLQSPCLCHQSTTITLPSTPSSTLASLVSLLYTGYADNIAKNHEEQLMLLTKELGMMTSTVLIGRNSCDDDLIQIDSENSGGQMGSDCSNNNMCNVDKSNMVSVNLASSDSCNNVVTVGTAHRHEMEVVPELHVAPIAPNTRGKSDYRLTAPDGGTVFRSYKPKSATASLAVPSGRRLRDMSNNQPEPVEIAPVVYSGESFKKPAQVPLTNIKQCKLPKKLYTYNYRYIVNTARQKETPRLKLFIDQTESELQSQSLLHPESDTEYQSQSHLSSKSKAEERTERGNTGVGVTESRQIVLAVKPSLGPVVSKSSVPDEEPSTQNNNKSVEDDVLIKQPGVSSSGSSESETSEDDTMTALKSDQENENPKPRILFSRIESSARKQLMTIVTRLGGVHTVNPREATHLVMVKLSRTINMLMCLPTVKFVLRTQWVVDSGEAGSWVSEEGHLLYDPEVERNYNFSLAKTLAMTNRDKLFTGKVFYLTPSVQPSTEVLTEIITCSGGRVENRRRTWEEMMKKSNSGGNMDYFVITCKEDIHLVTDVLRAKLGVFSAECVLSAVTRCEDFDLSCDQVEQV